MQKRKQTQEAHQQRVLEVLQFIRDHHDTEITLAALADIACHSPYYFERLFQEQTGVNVMQHVRNVRLLQAAIALRLTDRKIMEIALDAGYANHESFSRAFRVHFGESPSKFRKRKLAILQNEKGASMNGIKIGLVKIPVTDFLEATHYYREVIGLEEEFAVPAYGWAQYKTDNLPLCLYEVGKGGGEGTPGHEVGFHLAVANIETFYADMKSRGGQFASDIVSSADGGMFFVLKDPDGNTFKVTQSAA